MVEKDLRAKRRDDDVMNKMDNRNHGKDCVKLEHDLRVKMMDADYKEVDISGGSTNTDQTPSWMTMIRRRSRGTLRRSVSWRRRT